MTTAAIARLPYRPCVGIVLINAAGHVFAGQRIDSDAPAWQMPQGGIDKGESPREAALRELEEEIGIHRTLVDILAQTPDWLTYDLPEEVIPRVWNGRFRGQKQLWFLMRFKGGDEQIRLDVAHPEFSSWRWIAADDLLNSIVPFKRATYAKVLDQFSEHLA